MPFEMSRVEGAGGGSTLSAIPVSFLFPALPVSSALLPHRLPRSLAQTAPRSGIPCSCVHTHPGRHPTGWPNPESQPYNCFRVAPGWGGVTDWGVSEPRTPRGATK